jgi:nitric oxide reductase subunit C
VKLKAFVLISLVSYGAFIGANYFSVKAAKEMSEAEITGKQVWQKNECVSCHTLFGNGGYVGGDMTHVVAERGRDYVLNYMVKPPLLYPNNKQHHPGLPTQEAISLIEYLQYLDKIPTLGWPPQPHKVEDVSWK